MIKCFEVPTKYFRKTCVSLKSEIVLTIFYIQTLLSNVVNISQTFLFFIELLVVVTSLKY